MHDPQNQIYHGVDVTDAVVVASIESEVFTISASSLVESTKDAIMSLIWSLFMNSQFEMALQTTIVFFMLAAFTHIRPFIPHAILRKWR